MSITGELRRYAANWDGWFYDDKDGGLIQAIGHVPAQSTPVPKVINAIADRIDAEHEAACAEAYGNGVESVALPDMTAYVKLPVDADGEVIHIGDRVENNERVVRIVLTDGSWEPSVYVEKLPNILHEHFCHEISHYHAPTVEDVLREFGRGWYEQMNGPETFDVADYVERYAAKLRLAGEAE